MAGRIGWVRCGICGNPEASVTENAAGTLSLSCHKCQFSGYGKAGTKAARLVRASMTPDEETDAAPGRQAKPEEPMQRPDNLPPPRKAVRSAFELGNL